MSIKEFLFRYSPNVLYCKEANYIKQQWFCYKWISKHLEWSNKNILYDIVTNNDVVLDESIFMYWRQGWNEAPEIVKFCLKSVERNRNGHPLYLLDENNIKDYIRLPDHIEKYHDNGIIKEALYSDLLRISLLNMYGGYWLDATCFLSSPIPTIIEKSNFFMFSKTLLPEWCSPIKGSNWFIRSKRNNLILSKTKNFLFNYWLHNSILINYYLFHISLAAIIDHDNQSYQIWNTMPYICNMNPHVLQYSLGQAYDPVSFEHIVKSCFVHKLTYKYPLSLIHTNKKNNLQYLIGSLS